MEHILYYLIIGLLTFDFLLDRLLDYLNSTRWSETLPPEVEGIYDQEKYSKQQTYEKVNHRFSAITDTFSFAVSLGMFLFFGFAFVDSMARSITEQAILLPLLFFAILLLASDLINTPFELYHTFSIEERFGFNKTTVKTFILDKLKGWGLGAVIGGALFALIIFIYIKTTSLFWVYTWGVVTVFSVFMVMFYSSLIVPLFNKQTPLEDGELKDAINAFALKTGFKLDNIFVIDGSKRSTKANAYFTGLGKKKRVVLYDTLIQDLNTEELVAVLAHEIGHYKKKHIISSLILGTLQTGLMLFILSLFIGSPALSGALGVDEPSFHIGLIAFGVLYSPLSLLLGIGMNILSRRNEYQADAFAAEYYNAEALASALIKLSVKNLSNLRPHPAYVFFHYSHPTLLQRLAVLKKVQH